jgi:polyhydroxyalkanoate synthesis regulator phasin
MKKLENGFVINDDDIVFNKYISERNRIIEMQEMKKRIDRLEKKLKELEDKIGK